MAQKGLVLINTGHGKGKTSAAIGVMCRSYARGWNVAVVQFIKSGQWKTGERKLADQLGIEWHELGDGWTWTSEDMDETASKGAHAWEVAKERIGSGEFDTVICDEMTYAVTYGWIDVHDVVTTIENRPEHVNVVITGRNAADELIEIADTVTEMRKVKHAYDQGIKARKGIEY